MTDNRKEFENWLAMYMPIILKNLYISTHDGRWQMAKAKYDELWAVWQAATAERGSHEQQGTD